MGDGSWEIKTKITEHNVITIGFVVYLGELCCCDGYQ